MVARMPRLYGIKMRYKVFKVFFIYSTTYKIRNNLSNILQSSYMCVRSEQTIKQLEDSRFSAATYI